MELKFWALPFVLFVMVYRLRYITLDRRRNSKISLEANFFIDLLRPNRQQNYINLGESRCMAWTIYKSTMNESTLITTVTLYIRESGLRNLGTFCLIWNQGLFFLCNPESWASESGIQLKESGTPLRIGIRNPSSTGKESGLQHLESGIHGEESRIQLDKLDFLT